MALPSPSPHSPQQRPMEYASPPPSPSHVSRGDSFLESVTPIPHAKNLHPMLGLSSFGDGDGDGDEGDCARDGGGGYVSVNGDGDLTSPDSGMLTGEGIALGPAPPGYYGSDMTCTPATDNTSHTAAAQNAAALTAVARSSADLAVPRLGGGSDDRLGIDFGWGLSECVPLGSLSRLSQPPAAARGRSYTDPAMATLTGFEFRSGSTFGSTPSTAPPSSPPSRERDQFPCQQEREPPSARYSELPPVPFGVRRRSREERGQRLTRQRLRGRTVGPVRAHAAVELPPGSAQGGPERPSH